MDEKLLYKILRYSAQATVIYLLFRYFPGSQLDSTRSLLATVIILTLCIVTEKLCVSYLLNDDENDSSSESKLEQFDSTKSCGGKCKGSKKDEKEEEPIKPKKQCRVVCDAVSEGFDEEPMAPTGTKEAIENNIEKQQDSVEPSARDLGYQAEMPPAVSPDEIQQERVVDSINRTGVIRNENGQVDTEKRPIVRDSQDSELSSTVNDDRFYWGTRYGNLGYDDRYGFGGMFYDEYPFYNRFRNSDNNALKDSGEYYADRGSDDEYRRRRERAKVEYRRARMEDRARNTDGYDSRYQDVGSKSERNKTTESRRRIEGELDDELPYTDYNHLPIASGYKSHDYEYGYSFLPPEKWYPSPPRPPVCVSEKRCPVCPSYTAGSPLDVKEFHSSRRITPPDLMNTDYIGDKLNSGR